MLTNRAASAADSRTPVGPWKHGAMRLSVIVLIVHILAVSVWVGGQIVLAGLVPALRATSDDVEEGRRVISVAGRRFQAIAWSAFVVILFTGMWLILEPVSKGTDFGRLLVEKLVFVTISALAAVAHAVGTGPRVRKTSAERPERAHRIAVISGVVSVIGLLCATASLGYGVVLVVGY